MRGFRITVIILGMTLGLAMFIQTTLVYSLSSLFNIERSAAESGVAGLVMALMWLLAVALVYPLPQVSLALFLLSAFVGVLATPGVAYLAIWGMASGLMAGLSGIAWWEQHVVAKEKAEEKEMLHALLRMQVERGGPPPQHQGPQPGWQVPPNYGHRQG